MRQLPTTPSREDGKPAGHSSHGGMMAAMCVPIVLVAIVLVGTGVASASFLFAAIACMAMMGVMMAMMMRGMSGGGK
jgi:hypothetical protein